MELVSYDTPHIASLKAQYVNSNSLGGNMFWDVSNRDIACSTQWSHQLLPNSSLPIRQGLTLWLALQLTSLGPLTRLRLVAS